jgi:hypothetical protein
MAQYFLPLHATMKRILLIIISLCSFEIEAQSWTWDTLAASSGDIKLSKDACGHIWSHSINDTCLRKYTTGGAFLGQLNFPSNLDISSVVCSQDSTLYLLGSFTGTLTIQSGMVVSNGSKDIFIARFTDYGVLLWIRSIGSKGEDYAGDICMDGLNIAITGACADTTYIGAQVFPKLNTKDLVIGKFFKNGNLNAVKFAAYIPPAIPTVNEFSQGLEIRSDHAGNLVVLAWLFGKIQIDTFMIEHDDEYTAYVLLKFDPTLALLWHICPLNSSKEWVNSLTIDSQNKIYLLHHAAIQSVQPSSKIRWVSAGGVLDSKYYKGGFGLLQDLDVDSCDNLYFTGYHVRWFYMQFPPVYSIVNGQLSSQGTLNWIRKDSSLQQRKGTAIIVLGINKCYVAGNFYNQVNLKNNLFASYGHLHGIIETTVGTPVVVNQIAQLNICANQSVLLRASSVYNIQWYTSITANNSIATGSYYITPPLITGIHTWFVGASSCSVTTGRTAISVTVSACTDLQEGKPNDVIKFYPNPSHDHVTFELMSNSELVIYNALGKLVFKGNLTEGKNKIDLNDLSNGVYIVKLSSADKEITKKLMLDRP